MKTMILLLFLSLSGNLFSDEIPFVVIKSDPCAANNILDLKLKDPVKETLTEPGKAIKPVQDLSYSCFKGDMEAKNPATGNSIIDDLIIKIKAKYPNIDETEFRNSYIKWKSIKDLKNYVESETYYNPNTAYFEDKTKDNTKWRWSKLYCGLNPENKKETIAQRLERCRNTEYLYSYLNLDCNVSYTCYLPGAAPEPEFNYVTENCPSNVATFQSDKLEMVDPSNVGACLKFPSNAVNIEVNFSVCSTVVIRQNTDKKTKERIKELLGVEDDGTNLTLTAARLKELESILKNKLLSMGYNEKQFKLIPADESEFENYYYDPQTKMTYRTGTCGSLTSNDVYHESWVTEYRKATLDYVKANQLENSIHYTWLYNVTPVQDPKHPDGSMAPGRFNKVQVTYQTPKETPIVTKDIEFGPEKVFCVGINAPLADAKPNKKARGGEKKPLFKGKRKVHGKSTTPKPKGPDASCTISN